MLPPPIQPPVNQTGPSPNTTVSAAALLLAFALGNPPGIANVLCHPYSDPGGPYLIECNGTPVSLMVDGSGSDSCPGDPITLEWTTDCPGGSFDDPTAVTPTLTLDSPPPCPVECAVSLKVTNSIGMAITRSTTVTVADTLPPMVSGATDLLSCLWPADRRLVCFTTSEFSPSITDACSTTLSWRFVECTADEPTAAPADCVIDPDGGRLCARAARDRHGDGRNYAVSIVATDECDNPSELTLIGNLRVPRKPSAACSAPSSH